MSVTSLEFQAQAAESAPEIAIEGRSQWNLTWRRLRSDKMAVASVVSCGVGLLVRTPVIALLFERGSFTAESTVLITGAIRWGVAQGLPLRNTPPIGFTA